jgi:hypothetical protein
MAITAAHTLTNTNDDARTRGILSLTTTLLFRKALRLDDELAGYSIARLSAFSE